MKRLLVCALLVAGCAHHAANAPKTTTVQMEPMEFEVHRGKVEMVDAESLFERGGLAFNDKDFVAATHFYDELVRRFPDSRFVVPALYNAGLSLENANDMDAAAERYKTLIARPGAPAGDVLDAQFRLGSNYAARANWPAAAQVYAEVLERKDLTVSDRVEAMARRGVAQFQMKDLEAAERTLRDELTVARNTAESERLDTDFFVGMGAYYLGEIAHEEYRLLPVRLPEKQLFDDLEAKARMIKVAQQRFLDCMRVNNPEWATAAGYQFAVMYRELYDDLVNAPVPAELTGEKKDVYLEEVKKKVRPLLEHAIRFHEQNVLAGERVGLSNEWVRRSNEQLDQLRQLLVPGTPHPTAPPPAETPLPRPQDFPGRLERPTPNAG